MSPRGLAGLLVAACATTVAPAAPPAACRGPLVYFASLASGPGAGIVGARFDSATGALCPLGRLAAIDKPTWLVAGPRGRIYATSETGDPALPSIYAFAADRASGALQPIGRSVTGGTGAAYLSLDPAGRMLFVAHWGSGHVAALPLDRDGVPRPPAAALRLEATGPARVQRIPRAHAALLVPGRRDELVASDFSGDRLSLLRLERIGTLRLVAEVPLAAGAAPRHLLFAQHGRTLRAIEQLASQIATFRRRRQTFVPAGTVSTLAPGFAGTNDAAGLIGSADGRFVYVSNRGEDTVVAFAASGNGTLREVQRIASGGATPRAISLDPSGRWLLVADQGANAIAVFARDRRTGRLTATSHRLALDLPAGATFLGGRTGEQ